MKYHGEWSSSGTVTVNEDYISPTKWKGDNETIKTSRERSRMPSKAPIWNFPLFYSINFCQGSKSQVLYIDIFNDVVI